MSPNVRFHVRTLIAPLFAVSFVALSQYGCTTGRNPEYERLIADGNIAGAKLLMQRQIDDYSYREETPTLPLRRAQAYYWLARAHGMLGEYDSMKIVLLLSVSSDVSFEPSRTATLQEFSYAEYRSGIAFYNDSLYKDAKRSFTSALAIVGTDAPYESFAAGLLRYLAFCDALQGDFNAAAVSCREAIALGDRVAGQILASMVKKDLSTVPLRLQAGDRNVFEHFPENPLENNPRDRSDTSVLTP